MLSLAHPASQVARVMELLLETHGIAPDKIIATTRTPDRLTDFSERGVIVREADMGWTVRVPQQRWQLILMDDAPGTSPDGRRCHRQK
jgi:hypothetical protein